LCYKTLTVNTVLAVDRVSLSGSIPLEKSISLILVAALLLWLPPLEIQEAVVVVGLGHFFGCLVYQYKHHQINRAFLLRYFIALFLIIGSYSLINNFSFLVTVTSIFFVMHLSVDERFLWGDRPSLQRGLALLPFLILYAGLIIDSIYVGHVNLAMDSWLGPAREFTVPALGIWLSPYCLVASGITLLCYLLYLRKKSSRMESHDRYFLLGTILLAALYLSGHAPSSYYLIGFITLFHYFSWYVYYLFRWRDNKPKRNRYILDMLLVNAVILVCYGIYRWMPDALTVQYIPRHIFPYTDPGRGNALAYFFSPGYYYLWTLLHFASTARLSDLGYFRPMGLALQTP
jgi:hypothetical protein